MNLLSVILAWLAIIVVSVTAVKLVPGKIQPPRVQIENVRHARSPVGLNHAGSLGQFPESQSVRLVRKALADGDGRPGSHGEESHRDKNGQGTRGFGKGGAAGLLRVVKGLVEPSGGLTTL